MVLPEGLTLSEIYSREKNYTASSIGGKLRTSLFSQSLSISLEVFPIGSFVQFLVSAFSCVLQNRGFEPR